MGAIVHRTHVRTARILLSDDDSLVRRARQLLLRSRGFDVRAYTSGTALLLDDEAHTGDCLVVDYRMPDIDGISLLKRLRAAGWRGPAILLTTHYGDSLAEQARAAGFSEVLEKPLRDKILLNAIDRVLSGRPRPKLGR